MRLHRAQPPPPAPSSSFSPPAVSPPHLSPFPLPSAFPSCSIEDDYVNASYVQPLGTPRRYIATQGPLPATFGDFWTCVFASSFLRFASS